MYDANIESREINRDRKRDEAEQAEKRADRRFMIVIFDRLNRLNQ